MENVSVGDERMCQSHCEFFLKIKSVHRIEDYWIDIFELSVNA